MSRPPTTLPFHATPGLNVTLPRNASPIQYLELFMTMSLWRYLIDNTNNYARARLGSTPPSRRSLFRNWRDISIMEMKAFVGMIINMGLTKLSDIKDYWSRHDNIQSSLLQECVFLGQVPTNILDAACRPNTTKRSKIQPFLDLILPLFQTYLTPSREVSIDESMIAFRGRVGFRQYISGKPHPWGIKAYVLSESKSGYMYNMVIYYGKETQLITDTRSQPYYKCRTYTYLST